MLALLLHSGLFRSNIATALIAAYGRYNPKTASTTGANVGLASTYLYDFSVEVAHGGFVSLMASNSQDRTKKIFVNGVTIVGVGLDNIIGPRVIWTNAKRVTTCGSG